MAERWIGHAGLVGLLITVGACGERPVAETDSVAVPSIAPVASVATAPDGTTPPPVAASAPLDSAPAASCRGTAIAIEPGGLRLVDCASGRTTPLAIGAPDQPVIAALDRAAGAPGARSRMEECGAGPMTAIDWPNGLQVRAADGRLIGWSLDAAGVTTMNGIGVGSTRRALTAAFPAAIEETSLGTEFHIGDDADSGMGGLLDGAGPWARITTLWSGTTCHFT